LRRLVAALLTCSASLLAAPAAAGEPEHVVVAIVSDGGDLLTARLEAELHALGFATKTVALENATPKSLEGVARDARAAAAIHVARSDQRAEVWVTDRVTGKILLREVTVLPGEDVESVLAVRAVELLRASLLEIEAAHPTRGDVGVTDTVRNAVATSHPPRETAPLSLGLGFGAELMPTLTPAFHTLVSASWMPSRLGVELTAFVPVTSAEVCGMPGCAHMTSGLLGLGVRWVLVSRQARVEPEIGAGFAGAFVHAEGQATSPYVGASSDAAAATIYGRAAVFFRLVSQLRLGVDVFAGAALPPVSIRFAGNEVAQWGGPYVSCTVRTELSFP
jgi:hypothetical protein